MQQTLPYLTEQLELCQKSLTAFLDTKRAQFPRFYFVSDPTLLEILSLGSDPPSVTPHFQSGLFDSLTEVTFDKQDKTKMLEMFSQQNECVKFVKENDGVLDPARCRPLRRGRGLGRWVSASAGRGGSRRGESGDATIRTCIGMRAARARAPRPFEALI